MYDYTAATEFHGRQIPGAIGVFVNGRPALDAKVTIEDANVNADSAVVVYAKDSIPAQPNGFNMRFPLGTTTPATMPVIVNAIIDPAGKIVEAEVSAAADPRLATPALQAVQNTNFGPAGSWRQAYINVQLASTN